MYSIAIVLVSGIFAFLLSFAMGANDVANALGTSVGSKALSVKRAVLLAAVFEFLGVATLGQFVSGTLKNDIVAPELFEDDVYLFALGMTCTLGGSAAWLLIATYLALPVSTTQTIVGGIIAFASYEKGVSQINGGRVFNIILSWLISPILGGIIGYGLYLSISKLIFSRKDSLRQSIFYYPVYSGLTVSVLVTVGVGNALDTILLNSTYKLMFFAFIFIVTLLVVKYIVLPLLLKGKKYDSYDIEDPQESIEKNSIENMFKYLMILSAIFVAYAHGGNDVANSVGPFSAVLDYGLTGKLNMDSVTPFYVIVGGGIGIDIGLALLGYKVMDTVGGKITTLSFSRGYCAQFSAALTVLLATLFGLPISTTSVLVGGIAGTGFVKGQDETQEGGIDFKVLRRIMAGWVFTIFAGYFITLILYIAAKALI